MSEFWLYYHWIVLAVLAALFVGTVVNLLAFRSLGHTDPNATVLTLRIVILAGATR